MSKKPGNQTCREKDISQKEEPEPEHINESLMGETGISNMKQEVANEPN